MGRYILYCTNLLLAFFVVSYFKVGSYYIEWFGGAQRASMPTTHRHGSERRGDLHCSRLLGGPPSTGTANVICLLSVVSRQLVVCLLCVCHMVISHKPARLAASYRWTLMGSVGQLTGIRGKKRRKICLNTAKNPTVTGCTVTYILWVSD